MSRSTDPWQVIHVRVRRHQYDHLQRVAAAARLTPPAYLRSLLEADCASPQDPLLTRAIALAEAAQSAASADATDAVGL